MITSANEKDDDPENKSQSCVKGVKLWPHPTGIILTRSDYYTVPSLDELIKYIRQDGSCIVRGFTIGRHDYGKIHYSDSIDVSNLNLDEIVEFNGEAVLVYHFNTTKVPVGQGLNRRALVTLERVWPLDKKGKKIITDANILTKIDYARDLRRLCGKQGSTFIDYKPETGTWVFKVQHFSKYGHKDEDDDDEDAQKETKVNDFNLKIDNSDNATSPDMKNNKCALMKSLFENNIISPKIFQDGDDISAYKMAEQFIKPDIVPVEDSLLTTHNFLSPFNNNIADIVAFKGKSFKIGWTKQLTILCLAKNEFSPSIDRNISFKKITNLYEDSFQNLQQHLNCQLDYTSNLKSCGFMYSFCKLRRHQEIAANLSNDNYEKQIWNLMVTLFNSTENENIRNHNLSDWLKSVVESAVDFEVNDFQDDFAKILSYISGNKIYQAADLAMKTNNYNLALLISQIPNKGLRNQLNIWEKCDAFDYLNNTLIKIYTIISGNLKTKEIFVCENMDWVRIFALLFWYVTKNKISASVHMFENKFPPDFFDLRFEILKYYSNNSYSVTHVFNPFTYTTDPLDYRLCWFVFQILNELQQAETSKRIQNHMNLNFSAQLEQMGLWNWAIFILTFVSDNLLKKDMIDDILGRYVMLKSEETSEYREKEKMIVDQIKISSEFLENQKALKALHALKFKDAFHYFCFAKEWEKANNIFLKYYLDNLLAFDYEYLVQLLRPLSKQKKILPNWNQSTGLILDFAKLGSHFNKILFLRDPETIKRHLLNFRSAVINVSIRLEDFVPCTYLHDVCLAEISARIAYMLRKLLQIMNGGTYEYCVDAARSVQGLPMPSDYLKQELNSILIDFVNCFA